MLLKSKPVIKFTHQRTICIRCVKYVLVVEHAWTYMLFMTPSFLSVYCSYSIMRECWNDDKESRPTFLELKEEFDGLITQEERYNYLILDLDLAAEGPSPPAEGEAASSSTGSH